ncbi:MAG: heavy metal translocating P-type ATPase [Candidatus Marsarchaeota archaeon]|nr:heavy metal translocating P-type ATPase [Candidatus Marsarchaeota archaeon]
MANDPICGMYVDEGSDSITAYRNDIRYYFCSNSCKLKFERPEKEFRALRRSLLIAWPISIAVLVMTYVIHFQYYLFAMLVLSGIVQFYPGLKFYKGLVDAIRNRGTNMDMLIAIGTTAAWLYSAAIVLVPQISAVHNVYFDSSSLIIALILSGDYLQHLAEKNATSALDKLLKLQPSVVHRINGNGISDIDAKDIAVGDKLLVKPGERIPADGVVLEGESEVDESAISGESMPVLKGKGDKLIGATVNGAGSITMLVEHAGADSTLSKIIAIVEAAASKRVKIQKLADTVSAYFVPLVIGIAIASSLGWFFLGSSGLSVAVLVFVSVVIIACPCAFGIATPAALLVGSGKASENGILIKSGEVVELAGKIKAIILDKTGTITVGKPSVTDIIPEATASEEELLYYAASAELKSEHPIAKAVLKRAYDSGIKPDMPSSFSYSTGMGISAVVKGKKVTIGNEKMLLDSDIAGDKALAKILDEGTGAAVYVGVDGRVIGYIVVSDSVRKETKDTVSELKALGIEVWMVTGDNDKVARHVAMEVGINNVISGASPADKAEAVKRLQSRGVKVAVIGDGINDAPALSQADIGIAIGAGTDIAMESGQVVLMKSDLRDVLKLFKLSAKTIAKIKQNLAWAFGYNILLLPIAAGALVPFAGLSVYESLPILSAFAMAMSSTIVVSNSLLLKRTRL